MAKLRLYLEIAEETKRLTMKGLDFNAALRKAKEMYKEAHNSTDQSMNYEHEKLFNDIITDKEDIDNGEVFDIETGETTRDLILGGYKNE